MGDALDSCCEVARGEMIEVFQDYWEEFNKRPEKIKAMNWMEFYTNISDVDTTCKVLRHHLKNIVENQQGFWPPPAYTRLSAILDDWDKCEGEAEKVKDDLKEKPEGPIPNPEPYYLEHAKYRKRHPYPHPRGKLI